jgi:hypothetical protein
VAKIGDRRSFFQPAPRWWRLIDNVSEVRMRTKTAIVGVAAILVVSWVRLIYGQVQAVPGPGSGIVAVQGEVDVRRLPPIDVAQRGPWKISLAETADVRVVAPVYVAPPAFLRSGAHYLVMWGANERETIEVTQVGGGGWVRLAGTRARWVNLTLAQAIEEQP